MIAITGKDGKISYEMNADEAVKKAAGFKRGRVAAAGEMGGLDHAVAALAEAGVKAGQPLEESPNLLTNHVPYGKPINRSADMSYNANS